MAFHRKSLSDRKVEVYAPDFSTVYTMRMSLIEQMPPVPASSKQSARKNPSKLVLCPEFQVAGDCAKGIKCKLVHAIVNQSGVSSQAIHVNFAWRHESLCTYQRLPAGEALEVLAPNNRPPAETIPSEHILVTRGSLMRKEHNGPLSHCAHYYFNRMCNRGELCCFIHGIYINPKAEDGQRAPPPKYVDRSDLPVKTPSPSTLPLAASKKRTIDAVFKSEARKDGGFERTPNSLQLDNTFLHDSSQESLDEGGFIDVIKPHSKVLNHNDINYNHANKTTRSSDSDEVQAKPFTAVSRLHEANHEFSHSDAAAIPQHSLIVMSIASYAQQNNHSNLTMNASGDDNGSVFSSEDNRHPSAQHFDADGRRDNSIALSSFPAVALTPESLPLGWRLYRHNPYSLRL